MYRKCLVGALVALLIAILSLSCPEAPSTSITSIEFNPPPPAKMALQDQVQFFAVARNPQLNLIQLPATAFTWKPLNPARATVDGSGIVSAVSVGKAAIQASIKGMFGNDLVAKHELEVVLPVASIELSSTSDKVVVAGPQISLLAIARDTRGNDLRLPASAFTWSVESKGGQAVVKDGVVDGVFPGQVIVTATIKDMSGVNIPKSVTVLVTPKTIKLEPASAKIAVNDRYIFRVIATDARGNDLVVPASSFTWGCDSIYTQVVDKSGFVLGTSPGPGWVTASMGDVSGRADIEVVQNIGLWGTWQGKGVSYFMEGPGKRKDRITWDVTLKITGVDGARVSGTLTMVDLKHESLDGLPTVPKESYGPDPIENAGVSGTSLHFNVDVWVWDFIFTADTITGQFTSPIPGQCDPRAFVLTKQK
jgi:hypothetical protein